MSSSTLKPRLIIHGGAGNITRKNLSPHAWEVYSSTLLTIHRSTSALLINGANALNAATHAVALFEDSPLFNCGKGAVSTLLSCLKHPIEMYMQVFTRDGTIELEASVSKIFLNPFRLLSWRYLSCSGNVLIEGFIAGISLEFTRSASRFCMPDSWTFTSCYIQ